MKKYIDVVSISKEVDLNDGILVLRPQAQKMYKISKEQIGNLMSYDILVCNFDGIFDCSSSFVDEFVLGWQRSVCKISNVLFILVNMNEDVLYTVEAALNQRNRISKENLSLLAYLNKKLIILGNKIEKNSLQVFERILDEEYVTAREVAEVFNLELNSAGNRLKKLYDAHVVMRIEQSADLGGKFKYFIPHL